MYENRLVIEILFIIRLLNNKITIAWDHRFYHKILHNYEFITYSLSQVF